MLAKRMKWVYFLLQGVKVDMKEERKNIANRNVEMAKHSSKRSQVNKRTANKNNEQKTKVHATRRAREKRDEETRKAMEKLTLKINLETWITIF